MRDHAARDAISEATEGVINIKDGRKVEGGTFIWTCGVMGSQFGASLGLDIEAKQDIGKYEHACRGKG